MNKKLFVLDAESDGIYGPVLSIAAKAIDSFKTVSSFYGAVRITEDSISNQWVKDNVYKHLKDSELFFDTEDELLEAFWEFYVDFYGEYDVIADVPYPVETGIFRKCILKDVKNREKYSPFPIYDLESILAAKGKNQLEDRTILSKIGKTQHDAMNDVDMIIKILEGALNGRM